MSEKFNLNHLRQLEQRKANLELEIQEAEARPRVDDLLIHKLKAARLHLKDEIAHYAQQGERAEADSPMPTQPVGL